MYQSLEYFVACYRRKGQHKLTKLILINLNTGFNCSLPIEIFIGHGIIIHNEKHADWKFGIIDHIKDGMIYIKCGMVTHLINVDGWEKEIILPQNFKCMNEHFAEFEKDNKNV